MEMGAIEHGHSGTFSSSDLLPDTENLIGDVCGLLAFGRIEHHFDRIVEYQSPGFGVTAIPPRLQQRPLELHIAL